MTAAASHGAVCRPRTRRVSAVEDPEGRSSDLKVSAIAPTR